MPRDAKQTRKRILDAAYGQFRRRGYSRVSIDEIAGADEGDEAHALSTTSRAKTNCARPFWKRSIT